MAWVKLDDQIFAHPKIINLSRDAKLLYLAGLAYCAGQLTDGLLRPGAVRMVAAQVEADAETCAGELVSAGLWEADGQNFIVHDYLAYNPSGEQVKAEREAGARRQAALRERHAQSNGVSNAQRNGVSNGVTSHVPSPYPISDPIVDTYGGDTTKERDVAPVASAAPMHGALALVHPSPAAKSSAIITPLKPIPKQRAARAPDVLWDACVVACDGNGPANDAERGKWNKGMKSLRQSGATPEEIAVRAERYRRRYGNGIPLNPMALASNWTPLSTEVHDYGHHTNTGNNNHGGSGSNARGDRRSSRWPSNAPKPLPDAEYWEQERARLKAEGRLAEPRKRPVGELPSVQ